MSVEKTCVKQNEDYKVGSWGYRHQQCFILFFVLTIAYSMRSCIGLSLVAMTDFEDSMNQTNSTEESEGGILHALVLIPPYPKFRWNKKIQDTLIASFQWGYMLLQIPAGHLAHKYGARSLLTGAMVMNCIASVFLPLGAYYGGWICTLMFRIVQGLSQACIMPGFHTFFGNWTPLNERGRLTAITYGGQALGIVFGLPITGYISATPLGWPGIFRFYGVISGVIGAVIWFVLADTPSQHTRISEGEKKYIESGLGIKQGMKKKMPVPWSKILRSRGTYAIIVAHVGHTWGHLILYSEIPSYMNKVMDVDIKANGLLSALPFVVMWLSNYFFSWLMDMLIVKKILSVTYTRKLANTIGTIPAALGLILLAYVPQNLYVVETILVIVCSTKVASQLGYQVNHIDISPNFAGTMMSLSNFTANSIGSLAPIVTGFILTEDIKSPKLWGYVFFVAAAFYIITDLIYVIFGTGEKADWNDPQEDEIDIEISPMIDNKNGKIVDEESEKKNIVNY